MSLANPSENDGFLSKETNKISLKVSKVLERGNMMELDDKEKPGVLILGAGRVCQPVAEVLTTAGSVSSRQLFKMCQESDFEGQSDIQVIVASLYLKDAEEVWFRWEISNLQLCSNFSFITFYKYHCSHLFINSRESKSAECFYFKYF